MSNDNQAHDMNGNGLVTQVAIEALVGDSAYARASQLAVEALAIDSGQGRITQTLLEVLAVDNSQAIATQILLEAVVPTDTVAPNQGSTYTTALSSILITSDHLELVNYGTPILELCPTPLLCVNPGIITVSNPVLPNFPLAGDTIAYNMSIAPISLVNNLTQNIDFPAGLYVFYEKNNSVWYKFKTITSGWSNLEYLVSCGNGAGVSESRTIFDCAGYPITAYRDLNGNIGIHYYLDGVGIDNTTTFQGTSPNVIIYDNEILVMFIPPDYTNDLTFISSADCYGKECFYTVNIPNNVVSFSVRQTTNDDWVFTFVSIDSNKNSSIYYART